jgi:prepilin-type N-terminal cleavage/methylation domain-containing protein
MRTTLCRLSPRRLPAAPPRAGFTLTELIIALVLLSIGVLALAGTAAVAAFASSASTLTERAAARGEARLEALRAAGCAVAASGNAASGALEEQWVVRHNHAAMFTDVEVSILQRGRRTTQRYSGGFPC